MKKKLVISIVALVLSAGLLTGCSNSKKAAEEKEKGIEALAKQDYATAVLYFDKSIEYAGGKITEDVVDTCYYKVVSYYNLGKMGKALEQCSAMIDYDKSNPKAYYLRGSIYLKEGNADKAIKDYKKAVTCQKKDYDMYILVSRNLKGYGYTPQADAFLKQALELKGKSKDDYMGRGRVYLEMQEYDKAEEQLKKLGEKSKAATVLRADIALASKDYKKALSYYQEGLKNCDAKDKQRLLKGEIIALEYTGEFEQAKQKLEEYRKIYPGDEEATHEAIFLQSR